MHVNNNNLIIINIHLKQGQMNQPEQQARAYRVTMANKMSLSPEILRSLQQFEQLVSQFNNHRDFSAQGNKIFKEKERRLVQFSKNINSLIVGLIVLQNYVPVNFSTLNQLGNRNPTLNPNMNYASNTIQQNAIYFASQFVKDKLKFEFQQLNQQTIIYTHMKIVQIIRSNKNWSKVVRSNLGLCLSYLYIHCHEKLGSILEFFKKTFETAPVAADTGSDVINQGHRMYYQYLFRYLDGLCCEISNKRLVIDQIKREKVENYLKSQQQQIIMVLHEIFSKISGPGSPIKLTSNDHQTLLFCFSQWLKMKQLPTQIAKQLHNHAVVKLALSQLENMQLAQSAGQVITASIAVTSNPDDCPAFFAFLGQNLTKISKNIIKSMKQQQYDEADNFVVIFSQYASHMGRNFVKNFDKHAHEVIETMLFFTGDSILQNFEQLIQFWQVMLSFIKNSHKQDKMTKQIANDLIVKIYGCIIGRIKYSSSQIYQLNDLTENQLSNIHQSVQDNLQRREVSRDIFQLIGGILGEMTFINQIANTIMNLNPNDSDYWGNFQAYIFSLKDVIDKHHFQPSQQIGRLIVYYQQVPNKPVILQKSMLKLFESFLSVKIKNQQLILRILSNIQPMFKITMLSERVDETFQKCCQKNSDILVNHVQSIMQLHQMYPDRNSILIGLIFILKKDTSVLEQGLPEILNKPLAKLASSTSKKEKRSNAVSLFYLVESIPKGKQKNMERITELLLKQMWPIMQQILKQPEDTKSDQDKLIQRVVKFLKIVMRSIPNQFAKYLKQIFTTVLEAFKFYPITSYVYLFQVTFTVYATRKQPQILAFLKSAYIQYCTTAYKYISGAEQIENYQHLVDDFIGMNKRVITFNTKIFFESGQVQPILQFSVYCLSSSVPRVASTASQLLEIVFMIYWNEKTRNKYRQSKQSQIVELDPNYKHLYEQLKKFILPMVPKLLDQIFIFLEKGPAETARDNIIDCFQAIAWAFPAESQQLWKQPLSKLEKDILTQSQKQRLIQALKKLASPVQLEYINGQSTVKRLSYVIAMRFLYRIKRGDVLTQF